MSRSRSVVGALAVVMSLLVVTAQPAAAAHTLSTASIHTSDTDFDAGTLTNTTVNGTGASATVELVGPEEVIDSFEDGGFGEYDGETGKFSTTGTAKDGSLAAEANPVSTADDQIEIGSSAGLNAYPEPGDTFSVWLQAVDTGSGGAGAYMMFGVQDTTNSFSDAYFVRVWGGAAFEVGKTSGGSVVTSDNGATASEDTWYEVTVEWHANGDINATWRRDDGTVVEQLSISDTEYSSTATGFVGKTGSSNEQSVLFDGATIEGASGDGSYISANHTAEDTEQGFVNVTENTNATVCVTWETNDGSGWATLDQTCGITTVANHTFTWPTEPNSTIRVTVTVENASGNGAPSFAMADEGVQFEAEAPTVNNSSASPTGTLTTSTPTFEIDVSDSDFAIAQGDLVNASLYVDSTYAGSDTLTTNGTASMTLSTSLSGGSHQYHWVVQDAYGHTTNSTTFSVSTPDELRILNESAPAELVDNTTVELRFFTDELTDSPQVFTRNTSDGTVNMTGLPVDKSFIVVAEADGYYDRRIFVPSLFETQEVYLLPENESGTETIFAIKDYSGAYPQEATVLLVQRSLNGSYQTVLGDYFGATSQFPAVLETGVRHRLVLFNAETGESRVMGTYTPLSAATQTVTVSPTGEVDVSGLDVTIEIDPATRRLPARNDTQITVTVADGQNATVADWSATATVVDNSTSTIVWTYNQTGAGSETATLNLTGEAGAELVVNVTANTTAGQSTTDSATFVLDPTFQNDQSLLAVLGQLVQLSPEQGREDFTTFLAIAITVFVIGGLASQLPVSGETAAFGGVLVLAGFTVIAWSPPELLFVSGVGFVSFAALRRGL